MGIAPILDKIRLFVNNKCVSLSIYGVARTKKLANRHDLILVAGRELFGRYSFAKTTMEDIAKHVGISKGLIYLDFANKEAILYAIVVQVIEREQARMQKQIDNVKPPILHGLKEILLEHILSIYDEATSVFHAPQLEMLTVDTWKSEIGHIHWLRDFIAKMLKLAQQNSEIPKKKDYQHLSELLLTSLSTVWPPYPQYTTIYNFDITPKEKVGEIASELIDIFLAGLTVKKY